MQRVLLLLSILFALYASSNALSAAAAPESTAGGAPMTIPLQNIPVEPKNPASAPMVVKPVEVAASLEEHDIVVNPNAIPNIALLLPLEDKIFGESAQAVQAGFMAAASLNPQGLMVQVYGNYDETRGVSAAYRKAVVNGAKIVVGPLTRKGVSTLATEQNIPVPVLALNVVDANPSERLYFFGMSVDAEARTVATLAAQQNLRKAIVITSASPLAQRMQFSFEEAWSKLGRSIIREIEFKEDVAVLSNLNYEPDTLVFLATDAQMAHQIRPFLPNKMAVFSTSQIFAGNEDVLVNYDLGGIRFVDMPWLLQPDHPSVIAYPHSTAPLSTDQERLYALGIDAYRLAQLMLVRAPVDGLALDGVSGKIKLDQHVFQRTAVPGIFNQGRAQSIDAVTPSAIQMFPDQFKTKP
ncbi:MAG: penicillin-binding protein activator [Gallionella sp.]